MREFVRSSFVKICGVTSIHDAALVHGAGADALGLIIAPSRRRVTVTEASAVAAWAKDRLLSVLVVRELDDDTILDAVDRIKPDAVQLHDAVSTALGAGLRERGHLVIRALAIGSDEFWRFDDETVDAVLLDGQRPGSGDAHDWHDVEQRSWTRPIIAAGGLTSSNVSEIISRPWVWGVDVASGVEASTGHKDRDAIAAFVANARDAFAGRR